MDPGAGSETPLTVNEQVIVMSGHETIRVLEVGVDAQLPAEEESKGLEGVAAKGSQSGDPAEASQAAGKAGPDNLGSSAEATVSPEHPNSLPLDFCCTFPLPLTGDLDWWGWAKTRRQTSEKQQLLNKKTAWPHITCSTFTSVLKSPPGIPPSPAPAIATFSQAPSQPQTSQTLTPLAVQAAPQVRAALGSWTEGWGQERGMGQPAWGSHGIWELHGAGQGRGYGLREGLSY
uniref:POU class 6 homeobox 1 n=1 Tax=Macaca fascicularis TaxID=9541 RepID=A0A7N9D2M4_MACFA